MPQKSREPREPAGPSFALPLEADGPDFPCGPSGAPEEYGLALSGGGFRATLFHLGALQRLAELGLLKRIDRLSTVSGGSLMAGILAVAWPDLEWDEAGRARNFHEAVFQPTLRFAESRVDVRVIATGLLPFINPADHLARWLDRRWTRRLRLSDLPDRPRFIINAANLGTGVSWRFSKPYMGDSKIGVVCAPDLPLARAIAASAAFPPFVSPLVLDLRGHNIREVRGADLLSDPRYAAFRQRVLLLDGGAYDNLGIEPVDGRCRIVLASDAGGNLQVDGRDLRYRFWWPQLRRTLDLAVEVGRAQRRRGLIGRAQAAATLRKLTGQPDRTHATEHVALWRTSFDLREHRLLPERWPIAEGWREHLSTLRTRMWPMRPVDRDHLVNWGYLSADVMLRSWVPELKGAAEPSDLPIPSATFENSPEATL